MPKHSLLALIGFAESAVATVNGHRDKITAKNPFPTKGVESVQQLLKDVVTADSALKELQIQKTRKAADLRRLKRQLYDAASNLVDLGAGCCGKLTPEGRAISSVRKKLRPRRSPNTVPPKNAK
ncbi:MAG: hypothetical protein HZC54_23855 [Verrucomicrobia bacterium]|nr:hypothetical protein [Verrucomicrobiota bacterium]